MTTTDELKAARDALEQIDSLTDDICALVQPMRRNPLGVQDMRSKVRQKCVDIMAVATAALSQPKPAPIPGLAEAAGALDEIEKVVMHRVGGTAWPGLFNSIRRTLLQQNTPSECSVASVAAPTESLNQQDVRPDGGGMPSLSEIAGLNNNEPYNS